MQQVLLVVQGGVKLADTVSASYRQHKQASNQAKNIGVIGLLWLGPTKITKQTQIVACKLAQVPQLQSR
jgi:hypothetical protein